jgi:hypothetical protein
MTVVAGGLASVEIHPVRAIGLGDAVLLALGLLGSSGRKLSSQRR